MATSRFYLLFLGLLATLASGGPVAGAQVLSMMPLPAHVSPGSGELPVTGNFSVALAGYKDARLERAKLRFLDTLARKTGLPLSEPASAPTLTVTTTAAGAPVQQLGEDESYRLEITPAAAKLTAPTPLGAMHGLQTFLQLVRMTPQGFAVAAVTIDDQPRFPWRGLMLDVGRHFMPLPIVLQTLDAMEVVKLNVFHWHLSEDQGFRVESKRYPLLTEKGSDGLFYTQQQVREVVAYARDRGIRVVPEFDTPAHTQAWFPGYPELASAPGPYQIQRGWGVFDPVMDPTRESTYVFLDVLIREMAELFPDAYFHMGGDECNGKQWDANPAIQKYMKDHGLKDNAALQAYFTARVQKLVVKHGKIAEGWDEVLQPDTPKDVVIQSWRGKESLAEAARRGYRGVLSAGFYIDLNQSAEQHYLADPIDVAAGLTPEQQARILGGEATMWSEYVTPETVNSRIWPRTAAIAERLWSPAEVRDVESMYARLPGVVEQLYWVGIDNAALEQRMLERIAGGGDIAALRVLADVVQPPEGYARESLGTYTSLTPLNHLVDAVPPESLQGREFRRIVDRVIAHTATEKEAANARTMLTQWRENDAHLRPLTERSELAAELAPVSVILRDVAVVGLEAMEHLEERQPLRADRVQQMQATLKQASVPRAALVDMAVGPVTKLVHAAAK